MELKQKQHPVVDVTGDSSKVWCCKEQYGIGTWNVRSMNQGLPIKLEVVRQEMARVTYNTYCKFHTLFKQCSLSATCNSVHWKIVNPESMCRWISLEDSFPMIKYTLRQTHCSSIDVNGSPVGFPNFFWTSGDKFCVMGNRSAVPNDDISDEISGQRRKSFYSGWLRSDNDNEWEER